MRIARILISLSLFISCSNRLYVRKDNKSIIELINEEHQSKAGIKQNSSYQAYDKRVFEIRAKAVQLLDIETDTSRIDRFIVLDIVSFEGGKPIYGEIILNDTARFFYKSPFMSNEVEKYNNPIDSDATIIKYLNEHRFNELEALSEEKGKTLSGSNFIYVGMYEKGMDSIYVKLLPAFIMN